MSVASRSVACRPRHMTHMHARDRRLGGDWKHMHVLSFPAQNVFGFFFFFFRVFQSMIEASKVIFQGDIIEKDFRW